MLKSFLDPRQEDLLRRERHLLGDLRSLLGRLNAPEEAQTALGDSIGQLDELFLLVVVGEFNAGKSAVLNALLGSDLLTEGVTPTTSQIQLIRYADEVQRSTRPGGIEVVAAPVEPLRYFNFVDTPGTNAIDRQHEAITEEFIPRADLVLFITSADRPFTESERRFLEKIRAWGKKVVVVINKIDILSSEGEVDKVHDFVSENCESLLGFVPELFALSARQARRPGERDASGLAALESYVHTTLDEGERLRLKLLSPLGVAGRLVADEREKIRELLELFRDDVGTLEDLEGQQNVYREDMEREFHFRLGDVDRLLHQLENRGMAFFDETLRITRVPDLLNKSRLQLAFERQVIAQCPAEIEAKVSDIIDWMVSSELRQWQAVVEHVQRRQHAHGERVVGRIGANLDSSRGLLLESLGRTAQRAVESYDQAREANRLAESVQKAVASAALIEVGAVGLGAAVALAASTTAADLTGILAAGTLAALGLFVIPARRRRAKETLRRRLSELREELMSGMTEEFEAEIQRSVRRIDEATAPYTRFVRAEQERLQAAAADLDEMTDRLAALEREVETLVDEASRQPSDE